MNSSVPKSPSKTTSNFFDVHAHTNLSYCAQSNMTLELYAEKLSNHCEFSRIAITDHAMSIYFPKEVAWSWSFMNDSRIFDAHRDAGNENLAAALDRIESFSSNGLCSGIEAELMHDGRLTFDPAFRSRLDLIIGSVHYLQQNRNSGASESAMTAEFRSHTLRLLDSGIDILGHPFRWLTQNVGTVPDELVVEVVEHAAAAGVALELNAHYEVPADHLMLKVAAEKGVTVALGTDAHNEPEICNFSYHLSMLHKIDDAALKIFGVK